jgi:hypothetical protein
MKGGYRRYWEMQLGGPYSEEKKQIYKCVGCGAETWAKDGWNGEPDVHRCHPGCQCDLGDWKHRQSGNYRDNFDRIFPDSPGAGL